MAYQIQYKGVWAGAESRDWAPVTAIFAPLEVAEAYIEDEILPAADDRVEFRIVEIPMTFDRDGAIRALRYRLATSVYYLDRDATCGHYRTIRCWLEDGDLVQAHPTDGRRAPISAPADVRYYNYFDTEEMNVTPEAAWDSLSDLVAAGDFDGLAAVGKLASERISAGDNVNRWSAVQDATTVSAALLTLDLSDSSSGALREILLLGLTFIIRRWELINGAS